ncbi:membrane protein [Kitasatospora herbaricolor]|uniref:hypothetical protein n=1 Tax=Kitasatospora herbaricolor TaxID=68217 RepID=UPI00174EB588|nr:hypothetical protein [Kitasatospora herbaricolor]MDQ0312129.1 Mce-associated membrane protein [Kitasatospora herbaricolor]GGU98462.1 membrane protein [Kitasatospora herbaricolor]
MSTTRHLVNRRRRLDAVGGRPGGRPGPVLEQEDRPARTPTGPDREQAARERSVGEQPAGEQPARARRRGRPAAGPGEGTPPDAGAAAVPSAGPRHRRLLAPVAFALLTVLLGGFAAVAGGAGADLRSAPGVRNAALTDAARTNEVKGAVSQAVNALFSYSWADPAKSEEAAKRLLVGAAVQQYAGMLAEVRAQAPVQKLVLTTTVTGGGVEAIEGDRARVLIYADQRSTSTADAAKAGDSTYAAAMFAVDAVRRGGVWQIAGIDTFAR